MVTTTASKLIINGQRFLPQLRFNILRIRGNGKCKAGNLEIRKEVHRKIIEIGMVEILST